MRNVRACSVCVCVGWIKFKHWLKCELIVRHSDFYWGNKLLLFTADFYSTDIQFVRICLCAAFFYFFGLYLYLALITPSRLCSSSFIAEVSGLFVFYSIFISTIDTKHRTSSHRIAVKDRRKHLLQSINYHTLELPFLNRAKTFYRAILVYFYR